MKSRISGIIILLFLISCGSADQSTATEDKVVAPVEIPKFVLKTSDNLYVSMNLANSSLVASADSSKAQVFQLFDLGKGKTALKVVNGKFVSAVQNMEMKLIADRDEANDWETFEIIHIDNAKIQIKTSTGTYVSADQTKGGILIGDRGTASDWETFTMVQK